MWQILQYNLFSFYFDHSIQKQPKMAEYLILSLCNMKRVLSIFDQKP